MSDVSHEFERPRHRAVLRPAGVRAALYLLIAVIGCIAWAAWATDGFSTVPSWIRFNAWVASSGSSEDFPQDTREAFGASR